MVLLPRKALTIRKERGYLRAEKGQFLLFYRGERIEEATHAKILHNCSLCPVVKLLLTPGIPRQAALRDICMTKSVAPMVLKCVYAFGTGEKQVRFVVARTIKREELCYNYGGSNKDLPWKKTGQELLRQSFRSHDR